MGKVCKTKNQQRLCVGRRNKCSAKKAGVLQSGVHHKPNACQEVVLPRPAACVLSVSKIRTRAYACVGPVGYPSLINPSKAGGLCLSFPGDIGPSTKCILSSNAAHFCCPAAPACHRVMRSLQLACSSAVSAKHLKYGTNVFAKCMCKMGNGLLEDQMNIKTRSLRVTQRSSRTYL